MALCGDRGAGGASSRSQRAPAHSRARERCRFKRGCRAERLVVLSHGVVAPARQHDGKFGRGIKSERCARPRARAGAEWDGATHTPRGRGRRPRTVEDRGKVAGRRRSHNDSTLAS